MKVEEFTLKRNDDVRRKRISNFCRQGGLSVKTRLVTPKILSTGNEERCSVVLFKRHLEKRPNEMKKSGSFSLTVIDKLVSSVCYKKTLNRKELTR